MESHAIVIGIDGYDPAIGPLEGAVRDAVDFASWVTRAGGVATGNLRLLLQPDPAAPPPELPAGLPAASPVSSRGIRETIEGLRQALPAEGGQRLYFYYAGHGAAILDWQEDPFLIPPEFRNPRLDISSLLGFKDLFHSLGELSFGEQICLIDACRDFGLEDYEPVLPSGARRRLTERKGRQYVLYSVAPGQKAAETGQGVWTRTLLDGLEGRDYRPVTRGTGTQSRYEVRLDTLADWLRGEVSRRIEKKFLRDAARYVQTPQYDRDKQGGDPLMAAFTRDSVPKARLRVFVEPALAHRTCKVSVMQYVDGLGEEIPIESSPPPPIRVPVSFELRPSDYSIRAEAERFTVGSRGWTVFDDPLVKLTLEEMQTAPAAAAVEPVPPPLEDDFLGGPVEPELTPGGGEGPLEGWPISYGVPLAPQSPASATLEVFSADAAVRIEVLDARRRVLHQELGSLRLPNLPPGVYRVRTSLPGSPPREETVDVRPGAEVQMVPSPPETRLGASLVDMLRRLGVGISERDGAIEYVSPSEALGLLAGARLASLLAFASCAAQQPDTGLLRRLRSFGVHRFDAAPGTVGGVLALVGTAADKTPAELDRFLAECRLILRSRDGRIVDRGDFEPLSGLPAAAQRSIGFPEAGMLSAELHLPGMARTRYALAVLPERLTTFIAVAEPDGTVEVQQYLLRFPGPAGPLDPESAVRSVRRLDLAQTFYAAGEPDAALEAGGSHLQELLNGWWGEPLLGCLAGYGLVRLGQAERFASEALPQLLRAFPMLPDLHVLAGLCDPDMFRRDEHFVNALRRGLPLFAQGLQALAERCSLRRSLLAEPLASLVPGSLWTAWIARTPW